MERSTKLKDKNNNSVDQEYNTGIWSSGMILALGARGPEFNSRNAPSAKSNILFCKLKDYSLTKVKQGKYNILQEASDQIRHAQGTSQKDQI